MTTPDKTPPPLRPAQSGPGQGAVHGTTQGSSSGPTTGGGQKSSGCLKFGGIGCFVLLLVGLGVAIGVFFAMKRGPKNVQLTDKEKIVLEQKIEFLDDNEIGGFLADGKNVLDVDVPPPEDPATKDDFPEDIFQEDDQGRRVLAFTQREINGFLTEHPDFKDTLRLELNDDEVIARYRVTVPEGLPMGGKKVMVRGRLNIVVNDKEANASIESLTVSGISVPNAVIGELKGVNLLEQFFDGEAGSERFKDFVEELEITDDGINIKLAK